MKLYGAPMFPFVQHVLLTARFRGCDLALAVPGGGLCSPEMSALLPLWRIPVLVLARWCCANRRRTAGARTHPIAGRTFGAIHNGFAAMLANKRAA